MNNTSNIIDFLWEVPEDEPPDLQINPFFSDLFRLLDLDRVEVAVLVTNDERIREFNRQYRMIDKATDVLSFPNQNMLPPEGLRHLGDIVISFETACRQAADIGQSIAKEIRFLCLHGLLHLMGYDHETDDGEMLSLQSELKGGLPAYFEPPEEDSVLG